MKKIFFTLLFFIQLLFATKTHAQNVSINATGNMPDTSAMLDVSSIAKGLLIPRMTAAQMAAIILPAKSLLIFNTDYNMFLTNIGTSISPVWRGLALFDGTYGWKTTGDSNTVAGPNFLGTIDSVDLVFRTHNTEAIRITAKNNVGIGTNAPTGKLSVAQLTSANSGDEKAFTADYAYLSGTHTGTIIGGSTNAYSFSTGSLANANGLAGGAINGGTGTIANATGIVGSATNTTGGILTSGTGVSGVAGNNSTGTYSTATGVSGTASNNSTGALTTGYGGYFQSMNNSTGLMFNSMGTYSISLNAGNSNMIQSIGSQSEARNMGSGTVGISFGSNSFSSNKGSGKITTSYGAQSFSNNDAGGIVTYGIAAYGATNNSAGGTITHASGSYYEVKNSGGGNIVDADGAVGNVINTNGTISGIASGGNFTVAHSAGTTLGTARGIYTKVDSTGTGTITTGYGIYIDQIRGKSSYGIFQVNALNKNYFEGSVGIGISTPDAKLEVNGDVILTPKGSGLFGTLNDFDRAGKSNLYFSHGTAKTLNGINTPQDGMIIYITNGGGNLLINNNNTGSLLANRIITGSGGTLTITGDGGAVLVYTGYFWRVVSLIQ